MLAALILFILSCLFLYIGGWNRGKFECIIIFDSLKIWYGGDYSKDTFFNKDKDTNKDGKRSWVELTFPKDGGHRLKRYEMGSYGLASALFATSLWFIALPAIYTILIGLAYAPTYFAITGLGFDLGLKKISFMKKLILSMFIVSCFLCSCSTVGLYTKKQALSKFCSKDSVQFNYVDTIRDTIEVKGSETTVNIDCIKFKYLYDSLLKVKSNKLDSQGFYKLFEDSNANIYAKPEKDGSTSFKSETKSKKLNYEKPIFKTFTVPCNCPELPKPNFWQRLQSKIIKFLATFGVFGLIYFGLRIYFSRK